MFIGAGAMIAMSKYQRIVRSWRYVAFVKTLDSLKELTEHVTEHAPARRMEA